MSFSALDRPKHLSTLNEVKWDLLIIGGGITGSGILLDAISRGLSVALIEKNDFASGTSSRSTKLIHGGLRYLKNFEIGLVREIGRERAIVHANARHLVRPEPMLLPIYNDGSIGRITGSIGLWFYDMLADVDKNERRRMLSRDETIIQEPLLKQDGLLGSGLYYEYRTDDARLTLSILKKAVELGALALNYCEVTGFIYAEDTVAGVHYRDVMTGDELQISANVVVNASGPWLDQVLSMQRETHVEKKLLLSKGVHIVLPKSKVPISHSMYFDVPDDGRMIFCIPRDNSVYIGTTDTLYEGQLDDPEVTAEEIQYLVDGFNHVMENVRITRDDVTGGWAGLRPLIYEEGKLPSELSRKDEIFISPGGLISIAGGKLTGYRRMAERIIDEALKSPLLKEPKVASCQTENILLCGSNFDSDQDMQLAMDQLFSQYQLIPSELVRKLFDRYGDEAGEILAQAATLKSFLPAAAVISAEVSFAVRREMTHHLTDFLYRRTSDWFFDPSYIHQQLEAITQAMAEELDWNDHQRSAEREVLNRVLSTNP